jgi:hypothetical protein
MLFPFQRPSHPATLDPEQQRGGTQTRRMWFAFTLLVIDLLLPLLPSAVSS